MKKFWLSCLFVAVLGLLSNPVARLIPRKFSFDKFPFAPFSFEKGGKLYEKIGIKKWKDKVPDMSKILKTLMPKRVTADGGAKQFSLLAQETCVAELVHGALAVLSLGILTFWRDIWAAVFLTVYNVFGNLLFIIIQRYNRPRLIRLASREKKD